MRDLNNYPVVLISRNTLKMALEVAKDDGYAEDQLSKIAPRKYIQVEQRKAYQAKQRHLTRIAAGKGLSVDKPYKIVTDATDAWVILAVAHTGRVKQFVVNKE